MQGGMLAGELEGIVSSLGLFHTTLLSRRRPHHGAEQ